MGRVDRRVCVPGVPTLVCTMSRAHQAMVSGGMMMTAGALAGCIKIVPERTLLHVGKQRRDNKRVLNDYYFKEAKRTNYLSRAAFKLLQVNDKFDVFTKRGSVLDLGCFPGAWLQVACQQIGPIEGGGRVVGIDLKEMSVPTAYCDERVTVLHGDARELSKRALAEYAPSGFNTVLSDMCHNTTGSDVADVGLSLELCECAAQIAIGNAFRVDDADYEHMPDSVAEGLKSWERGVLSTGGALVMKILEGSGTKEFSDSLRPFFTKVGFLRPKATRQESREVYIVCTGRKGIKPVHSSDAVGKSC